MTRDEFQRKSTPWHVWVAALGVLLGMVTMGLGFTSAVTRSYTQLEQKVQFGIEANTVSIEANALALGRHRGLAVARIDRLESGVQNNRNTATRIEQQIKNNGAALVRIERSIAGSNP